MDKFIIVTKNLIEGFGTTLALFVLTLIISIPLGLIICFGARSKIYPLKYFMKGIIWVLRGTPLMLQIIVVFYLPGYLGFSMSSRFLAVIIAFSINYAAYFAEIFRGGIENIPKGQYEAGKVLGMRKGEIFRKIILLQVIKGIMPAMSNEVITLVKDTSLAKTIAVGEIIRRADELVSAYAIIWPLFYAGVFFLLFNGLVTVILSKVEKKLSFIG